jgi:2-keto-3-deoxy-L-rhamnonate aldolase RhmA
MTTLRERLRDGQTVIGSWVNTASPIVAEIMAGAGFDFLAVDAEHSAVEVPGAQQLFQAIRSGSPDCTPLVRLPGCEYDVIKRYCDAGAQGVVAPLVNTPAQARAVVDAVKYPPMGRRGVGFCRDNAYGANFDEAVASANDRTLVCVQIEHIDAVDDIEAILAVDGVDATFIGPYDLSASMGLTGRTDHPRVQQACDRVLQASLEAGVAPGLHVVRPDPSAVIERARQGYRLIAYSLDITMLTTACRDGLAAIGDGLDGLV